MPESPVCRSVCYSIQTMIDFRERIAKAFDPRKTNTNQMIIIAKGTD
jgi:hypothetical protein